MIVSDVYLKCQTDNIIGLSPLIIEKVIQLIKDNSSKKGIIITDHDYENVMGIATQLLLMKNGKIHTIKDKIDLITNGYLSPSMI